MGVGVEAPGRDHHSMNTTNHQGHSMTNGFNSDNHGRSNGGDQHTTEKESYRSNSESASAASMNSPPEAEQKCIGNKIVNHNNDHSKENNSMENNKVPKEFAEQKNFRTDSHFPLNSRDKIEDCNSSRESIDVETTLTEDIKPLRNVNTTSAITEATSKGLADPSNEHSTTVKHEEGSSQPVDWSIYHLGDMALDVWLQTVRKHIVVALIRHPKSEAFRRPVDPVALGIFPFYNQIITHPMDLGTVKSKIDRETYTDKSSCLQDINQVWLNAKKFNPKPHAVHQAADFLQKQMFIMLENLVKSGGATGRKSLPVAVPAPPPMRHVGIREAKKRPIGLPGEYDDIKPQHLEQKYASKLSESLKQCDNIMRNLMLQSQHWDYVEPFMKSATQSKGKPVKMSLALINERLRTYYYTTALEFATDMRRIITETYRAASEPIEEDFKAQKARLLQKEFELQFARVKDDEDSETCGMNKAALMKDPFISKLIKAQELMTSVNNSVTSLTSDVVAFMDKRRERKMQKRVKRQNFSAVNHSAIERKNTISPPKKRQRTSPSKNKILTGVQPIPNEPVPTASPEQIGEWIQNLDAEGQEHLLEILKRNNEEIEVDDEGEVELSLENWSNRTLVDVEMFLRLKLNEPITTTQNMKNSVQSLSSNNPVSDYNNERNKSIPEYHHPSHLNNTSMTNMPKEPYNHRLMETKSGVKNRHKSKSKKHSKSGMASSSDSSESSDESNSSSSDEN